MKTANIRRACTQVARKELAKRNRLGRAAMRHFERNIAILRQNARNNGYALTVHGSLLRDIDLLAVPWTRKATSAKTMKDSIVKLVKALYGKGAVYATSRATRKPHGRVAYVIHLPDRTYIDLSIMPRKE